MRLSVIEDDPGYRNLTITSSCSIHLDGIDITNRVFTADEELGKVWCFKKNEEGNSFLDPNDPSRAATELLEGKVKIELK